jgi:apolipoprotein D and lipocalin family protein
MAPARRLLALAALAAFLALPACALLERGHPPLATATGVELERYLGTWYEIASYPNRFQRGCTGLARARGFDPARLALTPQP